mgnify:CR=1 FL=1
MNRLFTLCMTMTIVFCVIIQSVNAGGLDVQRSADDDTTNRIIVSLYDYQGSEQEDGISKEQISRMEKEAGISLRRFRKMSGGARVLFLPSEMPFLKVKLITNRLKSLSIIKYAEPDRRMQPLGITPNDPMYPQQWNYYEPVGGINVPEAWALTTGNPNVVVAVIDTGILGDHEDIKGRWEGGYDFIDMRFNARDQDKRDPDPSDEGDWTMTYNSSWHGTHVAGTIGAATNNGIGGAGIDWQCRILPVRVLGRLGGFTSDIVDAMRWSVGMSIPGIPDNPTPAHVINMSLGGGGACDSLWQDAVNDVLGAGTVLVVAAGNESQNASNTCPASCDGVITVAATNRSGDLAWYSNYGPKVEISAPGGENSFSIEDAILSTLNTGLKRSENDSYRYYQGTSMATPHVAGVIALMYSINPNLTPAEVLTAIQNSAREFPSGTECANNPYRCGSGILDAAAAIESVKP